MVEGRATVDWERDGGHWASRKRFPLAVLAGVVVIALAAFLLIRASKKPPGLFVTSTPPGAHVRIDEKDQGITPLFLPDLQGDRAVVLALRGQTVHEGRVRILWSERKELDVTIGTGALLYVRSTPPGATVLVDGTAHISRTPALITDLPPGRYDVRIESLNYMPHETPATIVEHGEITTIDAKLTRRRVDITVRGPPDVFVTLVRRDNPDTRYGFRLNAAGSADKTIEVGKYTLRAVHVDYRPLTIRLTAKQGGMGDPVSLVMTKRR